MKTFFKVSQTYSEVTPESAEFGDFSDTGYEMEEREDYSIKDILRALRDQGNEELSLNNESITIYGWNSTICYKTGTDKQLCLHIKGSNKNLLRLKKIIEGIK